MSRAGINSSLMAEVTPPHARSTIYGLDRLLEGLLAPAATALVGVLAQSAFGFGGGGGGDAECAVGDAAAGGAGGGDGGDGDESDAAAYAGSAARSAGSAKRIASHSGMPDATENCAAQMRPCTALRRAA